MLLTFSGNAKRSFLTSGPGAERLDISRQTCAMWHLGFPSQSHVAVAVPVVDA